ncbi:MAG: hypothetical protein II946_01785 [Kiritimatiellae bacterium]|nr:hypothetical protein [Kiritimatiellia bacterium]
MFADTFHKMEESLTDARIAAAEADIKAGRVTRGTADELIADTFSLVLHTLENDPHDPDLRLHALSGKHLGKHAELPDRLPSDPVAHCG